MAMTDGKRILDYIIRNGSITTAQSFYDLGISKLSTRVSEMRAKGTVIADEWVDVDRRDGKKARVKRYFLPHDEMIRLTGGNGGSKVD